MNFFARLSRSHRAVVSTLRLWLVFLSCAGVAAALIATLQRADVAWSRPIAPTTPIASTAGPARSAPPPRTAFAPTFADAAGSLRAGRHAGTYGRFVQLADDGDVDAGRIALVMHRFGPEVYGSAWDASVEQLAEWTRWSEAAAARELAQVIAMAARAREGAEAGGPFQSRTTDARPAGR